MEDIIDFKVVKIAKMQDVQQKEHSQFFEISEMRNKRVLEMEEKFDYH